jgi:V-type H+-transporting ATPase subunit a
VLWSMTIGPALGMSGVIGVIAIVIFFAAFLILSVIILIIMEGVSAMLHSLRLAWVESFSKFAEFNGWPFTPFSFKNMLEESEELREYLG